MTGGAGPADVARAMVLWCPDWPVVAAEIVAGVAATGAVAVLRGNRVVACSEAARADGVRRGLRRREAQGRCPELVVVDHDAGRDARAFEPVVAAVEQVAVGVEVVRPGVCAWAARGPARYFGGEERAAERIVEQVAEACAVEAQIGVADGVFAAGLAAREGRVVVPGGTPDFLAGVAVEALDRPELTDLLRRLGVRTLGEFAALPAGDVLDRFGSDGALAYRLAGGGDRRPLAVRRAPPDLAVTGTYEDPLERVDVAAFAGRALAEALHDRLAAHGLACTRLGIEAVTADGQELHRIWRHDGLLTAAAIAERVRWQLDGWLSGTHRSGTLPTAGLVRLRLVPDGVVVHLGLQPGLWGDAGTGRDRAHRALSRIQGLLGPDAVVTAVLGGGRSAADQVRLVPWGDEPVPARPGAADAGPPVPDDAAHPTAHPTALGLHVVPDVPGEAEDGDPPGAPPALVLVHGGADPGRPRSEAARGPGGAVEVRMNPAEQADPAGLVGPAGLVDPGAGGGVRGRRVDVPEGVGGGPGRGPAGDRGGPADHVGHGRAPAGPVDPVGPAGVVLRGGDGEGPVEEAGAEAPTPGAAARKGVGGLGKAVAVRPRGAVVRREPTPPWPGRLPWPAPALVLPQPLTAVVRDAAGDPVRVSARLELSGDPAVLHVDRAQPVAITGWVGPWPLDERWWAPAEARRRVRFQAVLADDRAVLLFLAAGEWAVEAIYD